jgi:outer membrane protein
MKMIKNILVLLLCISGVQIAEAQKFAYVDSQYMLESIPQYKEAQEQLNELSGDWQAEIEARYQEIDGLYRAYTTEKVLLTDQMRQGREDEIIQREQDVKALQKQRFGPEGDLFKKQEELIRPLQNQIYNAIQEYAQEAKYGVIFDKSSDLLMLYADEKLDKSDLILDRLGYDN